MQPTDHQMTDWGILSPAFYAVSSCWMIAQNVADSGSTAHVVISIIPGVLLAIGSIIQTISLVQHRRDKLQQDGYIRELEIRNKLEGLKK